LAAVPGVWFRLVSQAALGVYLSHQSGLIHGRLTPTSYILTRDGVVKLCGLGEPSWLHSKSRKPTDEPVSEPTIQDDLRALGRVALEWSLLAPPKKKSGKTSKPLPDELQEIITKLGAEDGSELVYQSVEELLGDLDLAGSTLPGQADAWAKLIEHVNANATDGTSVLRQAG